MLFMTSERGEAQESVLKKRKEQKKRHRDLHGELIDRPEALVVASEAPVD